MSEFLIAPGDSPVEGQKLVVALPMYRQLSTQFFFNWLQMDKRHVAAHVATDGAYLSLAMTTLVDKAQEVCPDYDRIVLLEHDMIPPVDALNRIATYGNEYDIVGSMYFQHEHPYHVMAWMAVDKPRFSPLTREMVKIMHDNPGLYPVDAVATGFTSIARRVIEEWDPEVKMWIPQLPFVGHDMHFCHEAKKQGFNIFLDSGMGCGHLTTLAIGYPHSQEALAQEEPPTWQQMWDRRDEVLAKAIVL